MAPYIPRERKHRKRARTDDNASTENSNAEILLPREERREQLKQDLRAPDTKLNPKKRKRLDKYVESKLRKEENADILAKIAKQDAIDTSLFQSSKRLGRVGESKRERLQRALRERDAGIGNGQDDVLFESRREVEAEDESGEDNVHGTEETEAVRAHMEADTAPNGAKFGGGLKQPLEMDAQGKPVIKKRKRRKKSNKAFQTPPIEDMASEDEGEVILSDDGSQVSAGDDDEWQGFSDSEKAGSDAEDGVGESSASISDGETSEASQQSESGVESEPESKPRISAFKQWADAQRNAASDFTPSALPNVDAAVKAKFKPRAPSPDPMLASTTTATSTRPEGAITIDRSETVQTARLELPVVQEEQRIMEAIHSNPITVICGATGSGKTTQIPQMLYENGYGSRIGSNAASTASSGSLQNRGTIGITQPRRVAATSVADRVAHELGPSHRNRVAHQVRYDSNVGRDTAIKFMTDGILLREIQQDFALTKYSCIVVDEAHERSVNTDILIGLLSRIVPLRHSMSKEEPEKHYPLKLIIMSATLRVADFLKNERLFKDRPPPIVEAEGRQYPVAVHFARRTRQDFLDETVEKVAKGHKKLPPGGMLVFLTGQQEIQTVAARLRERLGGTYANSSLDRRRHDYDRSAGAQQGYVEDEMEINSSDESDAEIETEDNEFAIPNEDPTSDSVSHAQKAPLKPHILPLYAALSASQQAKVFSPPPENHRQIILATNVAETSLTIPGIRYVFDCGRSKEKVYSTTSGIQSFETQWISKASASQRTGRAGRTGPGHCWRFYSSAVFEQFFAEHADPEILRTPLESVVLQLKGFHVENVVNFPFPTAPERLQLAAAEGLLVSLGAIGSEGILKVGEELARLPVSPRFGKMLLKARETGVLEYVVPLVAGLAVGELFIPEPQSSAIDEDDDENGKDYRSIEQRNLDEAKRKHHQAYTRAHAQLSSLDPRSDAIKLVTAVVMHAEGSSKKHDKGAAFAKEYFLRQKGMEEAQQLRSQLWNILSTSMSSVGGNMGNFKAVLPPPTEGKIGLVRQAAAAGFVDQVAIRADLLPNNAGTSFGRKPRRAIEVAYRPLVPLKPEDDEDKHLNPSDRELQRSIFIHPSSPLSRLSVAEMPEYIAYTHLSRSSNTNAKVPRTRMHALTPLGPKTLAYLAEGTPMIAYGKPITAVGGGKGGKMGIVEREGGQVRECWVPVSIRASEGGAGAVEWPLDCWKVVQRRGRRGEWAVERVLEYGAKK